MQACVFGLVYSFDSEHAATGCRSTHSSSAWDCMLCAGQTRSHRLLSGWVYYRTLDWQTDRHPKRVTWRCIIAVLLGYAVREHLHADFARRVPSRKQVSIISHMISTSSILRHRSCFLFLSARRTWRGSSSVQITRPCIGSTARAKRRGFWPHRTWCKSDFNTMCTPCIRLSRTLLYAGCTAGKLKRVTDPISNKFDTSQLDNYIHKLKPVINRPMWAQHAQLLQRGEEIPAQSLRGSSILSLKHYAFD